MKHKLIALSLLLFSYSTDMEINASVEEHEKPGIDAMIIKQLNNLEQHLEIDEASRLLIKKYWATY